MPVGKAVTLFFLTYMPDGYGDWLGETEQERIRGSNGYLEVLQRVTAASSVPLQADLGVSFTIPQGSQ